jgi:hypothetical protein
MKPIIFACKARLPLTPDEIAEQILDLKKWPDFHGYGLLPGIKTAEFEVRSPNVVGSRIRVTNRDGSTHIEEIVDWRPDQQLQLRMDEFSPPLSRLATHFMETWNFQREADETHVTRSFELNAKSMATIPILWLISFFLKKAIFRHLREIRNDS